MQSSVLKFYNYLEYDKKMKTNTINSYKRDIDAFFKFVTSKTDSFSNLDDFFDDYINNLRKIGRSAATISRNIASLRGFFKYLVTNKIVEKDPTKSLKYEKKTETSTEYDDLLTTDEIDNLISVTKTEDVKGYRDCAIIETLYACGLKVSELLQIKLSDLHLTDGYITIHSDGDTRYAPVYKGARMAINEYLKKSRKYLVTAKKNEYLFLNRDGEALTRQGLWKILKSYGKKANITKEITPHLFRQSMAVHLMENGANINDIKEILGHKHVSLTMNYVKNFKPRIVSIYENLHPKAIISE